MNHTYNPDRPYAVLMAGRPEEPSSHRSIAVYNKAEYEEFRQKGWKPEREFYAMHRRAVTQPKGYWND